MKIERQTELRKVLSPVVLPKMAVIEQHFLTTPFRMFPRICGSG